MKVLLDTSAWIEHFKGTTKLVKEVLLDETIEVLSHRMVIAELMLGGISSESEAMDAIKTLTTAKEATSSEVMAFIEANGIFNKGVGFGDCSILASCILSDAAILTFDKNLMELAKELSNFDVKVTPFRFER